VSTSYVAGGFGLLLAIPALILVVGAIRNVVAERRERRNRKHSHKIDIIR
jgi:predicted PurR-regulated permease PerM